MNNLVDLHAHILPGLDDGPGDIEGSLKMLQVLEGLGYRHVFATPHHRLYSWEGIEPQRVVEGVHALSSAASVRGIDVCLYPGMEFDLDDTLPERGTVIPGGGGHLLVDVGFLGVPRDLAGLFRKVMDSGATVFLVHPERNQGLCRLDGELPRLVSSGVRLVGNIGSFSGMYGPEAQRDARALLEEGLFWALASDLHSEEQARWIEKGFREIISQAGYMTAEELMKNNPMQMVKAMEGDR